MTSILEEIQRDPWPVMPDKRPLRATGTALAVAVSLLECSYSTTGARIMLFVGGPATHGPGMVVSHELKESIRSHHDIEKENAKCLKRAVKFYEGLSTRAATNSHSIDVLAGCLDQVGLLEMRSCVNKTGGSVILADSFNTSIYKQSFIRMFAKDASGNLNMAFNATMEVHVCCCYCSL